MTYHIITDSSCEYRGRETDTLRFIKIPFLLRLGDKEVTDDEALDVPSFLAEMEGTKEVCQSACPSPLLWREAFLAADCSIAITISAGVSGCYGAAAIARDEVLASHPEKKILLLDSMSAGSALSMLAAEAETLIADGRSFEALSEVLTASVKRLHTVFALSSFDNLVKNGRMNKIVGMLAGKLGFWGIGIARGGRIVTKGKTRGEGKMIEALLSDMKENGFAGGRAAITHCLNEAMAETLKERIVSHWPGAEIVLLKARGLCSFYAERGGLILGYEGMAREG